MQIPDLILRTLLHVQAAQIALSMLPEDRPVQPDESRRILTELRAAVTSANELNERVKGCPPPIASRV